MSMKSRHCSRLMILGRSQLKSLVGAGGTRVGQLLCLAYVQLNILGLGALSHHHAGVDLNAWPDEEVSSLLGVEQAVGDGFTGLEGDQGAVSFCNSARP